MWTVAVTAAFVAFSVFGSWVQTLVNIFADHVDSVLEQSCSVGCCCSGLHNIEADGQSS
jgi:hypothetical protein